MELNKKKTILAEKISNLICAVPTNIASDDENEETKAKVVEHYTESDDSDDPTRQSKIRNQNVQFLDEFDKRYEGKKVSRKDLYEEDHESNSDNEEPENESADEANNRMDDDDEDEDEDLSNEDEDEDDDGDEQDLDKDNPLYRERYRDANFNTMSSTNVEEEMEKGRSIKNQLRIWETLLEMRIKLQQCLADSNKMPQYDMHKSFRRDTDFMKNTNDTKTQLTLLLDNMLSLQTNLWAQYPETKSIIKNNMENDKDDSMNEEIPSDTEDEEEKEEMKTEDSEKKVESLNEIKGNNAVKRKFKFVEYEKILAKRHKSYVNYRNTVISKWNDKTRVATGKVINKGGSHPTLKQIEFALSDKVKLLKRTQLKRSEYNVIGKSVPASNNDDNSRVQEYDPEIYDDDDFYGQLLKDLIEYKSSNLDPKQLSEYRNELNKKRSEGNRRKRQIDTRATKGRKVRYNVHNKLVNYMAPITVYDTWTDVSKNELYNSLFGKIKPVETIEH